MRLSVVIPTFREASKIGADIDAAGDFLRRDFANAGEIVVADDGSDDGTATRAAARAARVAPVPLQVLRSERNRGKGHALRRGVAASRGAVVLTVDAGGCVPLADAHRGLALLARGADVAHGSRRHADAEIADPAPWWRRLGSRAFRLVQTGLLHLPPELRDTQCGFKLYRGEIARPLFGQCQTDGFMIDSELILRARRAGLHIAEFGVRWTADRDSRFRPTTGSWRNARELWRIRHH